METIYTPEEVADLLEMETDRVLEYLETGVFPGFRVDSYWRITAGALNASLSAVQGIERVSSAKTSSSSTSHAASVAPPPIPIAVENPNPEQGQAVGQLLVFSDVPGEEVYLDGSLKGPTTLSVMNIRVGEHELRIGDATSTVSVVKDFQLRVRKKDGEIEVLSHPKLVAQGGGAEQGQDDRPVEEFRLSIDVDNDTDFSGPFTINLSAEHTSLNAEVFGLVDGEAHPKGLRINEFIPDHDAASLFNGTIKAHPGDRIFINVPRQEGLSASAEHVLVMQADSYIKMSLSSGGLLGRKQAVKFSVKSAPH